MPEAVQFGTSGLRGLVTGLTPLLCQRYTQAFLRHLETAGFGRPHSVYIGYDLRESSPAIAASCAAATDALGVQPVMFGALSTPALALAAIGAGVPALMVTGSHIPADRNGIKFYRPDGEISKPDEAGITREYAGSAEMQQIAASPCPIDQEARGLALRAYHRRALIASQFALAGADIGFFEHSSVARDLMPLALAAMGARVHKFGRSDIFIPVDTEALEPEMLVRIASENQGWDAIVSTDGDGDRPLLIDERGHIVPGDVLGIFAAKFLGARTVVTPVTSTSNVETCGLFEEIRRTRVGSPYVIAGINEAIRAPVVGFEANGGVLVGTAVPLATGETLAPLATRDAMLPIVATLCLARAGNMTVSALVNSLPQRFTFSGLIRDVPKDVGAGIARELAESDAYRNQFMQPLGDVHEVSSIDGTRLTLASGAILHVRPSGNAPELRCYSEAESPAVARQLVAHGLDRIRAALGH